FDGMIWVDLASRLTEAEKTFFIESKSISPFLVDTLLFLSEPFADFWRTTTLLFSSMVSHKLASLAVSARLCPPKACFVSRARTSTQTTVISKKQIHTESTSKTGNRF